MGAVVHHCVRPNKNLAGRIVDRDACEITSLHRVIDNVVAGSVIAMHLTAPSADDDAYGSISQFIPTDERVSRCLSVYVEKRLVHVCSVRRVLGYPSYQSR